MMINNQIAQLMMERVAGGLKRRSLTQPSQWAESYRIMGKPFAGPWGFKHHPWLKEMHDSQAEMNVGQKCAQMGYSETALNLAFYYIDAKGLDVLYVLPAKTPDASDFSASRFNPALELSPHLSNLFSDVQNIGHKRAGTNNLYIRGSKSRGGLKSIPVGAIFLDEVEEMDQDNIPLALERTSGQIERHIWLLSTPRIDNRGINLYYQMSTQEHFFFKCPCCSRRTELTFPECISITGENPTDPQLSNSKLICKECKSTLYHETKHEWLSDATWVPTRTNTPIRGFHVNRLYSCARAGTAPAIAAAYLRAQTNPADEQEFYNSVLGLTHAVDGARITDKDIDEARRSHSITDAVPQGIITLGIDVGSWLHYQINLWRVPQYLIGPDINIESQPRIIKYGKVKNFEDIDLLIRQYRILFAVIDANPEKRKALELANRFNGMIKLCYYGRGINGKVIHISKEEPTITVDRTSWLDLSLSRFTSRPQRIELPRDIDLEYREHLKALVRIYEKDRDGNPIGRYDKGNADDHYAHAANYAELALPFAASAGRHENIGRIV